MRPRQFQRIPSSIPATVHLSYGVSGQTSRFDGEVRDLSVLGLCVILGETFGAIAPGAKTRVVVERPGSQPRLEFAGAVVNSAVNPDSTHRLHIRFDRVYHEAIKDIAHHKRIVVELNPYGWTEYRQALNRS